MLEQENELDDQWMKEFENLDKEYSDLYNNDISFINIHFIYINSDNNIEKIQEKKFIMSKPNYIGRDELLGLIKRNFIQNNISYFLLSILKYNFNLQPQFITSYLKRKDSTCLMDFLTPIKNIDTIKFEKTISMFQDINDLFFLFYQKVAGIPPSIQSDFYTNFPHYHSITKRIYLKKSHRKTQRK